MHRLIVLICVSLHTVPDRERRRSDWSKKDLLLVPVPLILLEEARVYFSVPYVVCLYSVGIIRIINHCVSMPKRPAFGMSL